MTGSLPADHAPADDASVGAQPDPLEADVLAVDGVTGLTRPPYDDGAAVEVHIGVRYGTALTDIGEQVAAVVVRHAPDRAVHVHVDDVA